ncbi:hypothetical protein [Nocardioides sp. GXZ039]|uniref:hypothetical protein n=1 Tax=Nocardioides sp. GXZ039 TaxID=3136018 RepID=UPI0030F445C1
MTPGRRGSPTNRLLIVLVMVVLTLLSLILLKGDGPGSGEMLIAFTQENGVNSRDLPILGLWLTGMVACGVLLWRER